MPILSWVSLSCHHFNNFVLFVSFDRSITYKECGYCCNVCNRRTRNQAEAFVKELLVAPGSDPYKYTMKESDEAALKKYRKELSLCSICMIAVKREISRILERYKGIGSSFGGGVCLCTYASYG